MSLVLTFKKKKYPIIVNGQDIFTFSDSLHLRNGCIEVLFLTFFFCFQTLDCMDPLRPYESSDTLKQFLEYDRKVLRFFCLWDDSASLFGDRRELILHYFLSDDTIEVKEVIPHNSGRDAMSLFLQRRKLPKVSSRHRTLFRICL